MYTSFSVRNFRCFRELEMKDLARVNLITGKNNVGKSTLLDALFIHSGYSRMDFTQSVDYHRGLIEARVSPADTAAPPWVTLFHRFDTAEPIVAAGRAASGRSWSVTLRHLRTAEDLGRAMEAPGMRPTASNGVGRALALLQALELTAEEPDTEASRYYTGMDQEGMRSSPAGPSAWPVAILPALYRGSVETLNSQFGRVVTERRTDALTRALAVLEPRLRGLHLGQFLGVTQILGDVEGWAQLVPLAVMGDGMGRLIRMLLGLQQVGGGVLLVDEVENGFHHSSMRDVWRRIADAARDHDTQIFATTHSWECVVAAHEAFSESLEYDLRMHRLDAVDGRTEDVVYDQETLAAAIEIGMEVR